MEENRDLLKNKITEAKTLGERVNQSRATISYLKNSIEAIRRYVIVGLRHYMTCVC